MLSLQSAGTWYWSALLVGSNLHQHLSLILMTMIAVIMIIMDSITIIIMIIIVMIIVGLVYPLSWDSSTSQQSS